MLLGDVALEAVRMIARIVKQRGAQIQTDLLATFLELPLHKTIIDAKEKEKVSSYVMGILCHGMACHGMNIICHAIIFTQTMIGGNVIGTYVHRIGGLCLMYPSCHPIISYHRNLKKRKKIKIPMLLLLIQQNSIVICKNPKLKFQSNIDQE